MSDAIKFRAADSHAASGRAPLGRRVAVALATLFAVAVPAWQMGTRFGLSAAPFSAQGDSTLRAAPWAFAIWGVIYPWLILYAGYQLLTGRETPGLRALGWPSVIAIAGCGVWILASAMNAQWATVGIIFVSAGVLTGALMAARRLGGTRLEAGLATWPLALLAGWLTVASALNLLTVLTAQGLIAAGYSQAYALAGIGIVALGAALIQLRTGPAAYGLAVTWGLTGVTAAEIASGATTRAVAAGAAAVLVGLSAFVPRR